MLPDEVDVDLEPLDDVVPLVFDPLTEEPVVPDFVVDDLFEFEVKVPLPLEVVGALVVERFVKELG
ncbi:hypothetical protein A8708_31020 [Paenibacillus oryzisoli]|uniref:Uncharacterized protein n=1 Tax=Paenibacillus oryzisoli TaxID=1850517 RepID=A0A198AK56_9BACL|nr:hypothetical protein A8708_31020 [Paenibacillus oryzisoli]